MRLECYRKAWRPKLNRSGMAAGSAIRGIRRLRRTYGPGLWRKRKGFTRVRLEDGIICRAEIHGYEAHGVGKKEPELKRRIEG